MKKGCLLLLALLWTASGSLLAQERADSIAAGAGLTVQDIEDLTKPLDPSVTPLSPPSASELGGGQTALSIPLEPALTKRYVAPPLFRIAPERPILPSWGTGYMYGYSGQGNDWLRGYQATAGIGLSQRLGDYWTFNANASVYKNSIYYNSASFGSSLHWQPNSHFGVTVFGNYSPGSFMSSVSLGPSFNWGGYMTVEGEYFGIDMGAQQYYDPFYGHNTTPIVRPFVKLGGAKLGIDVGPMIKDALQKDRNHNNGFNPIPQPIKALPQVAPRR